MSAKQPQKIASMYAVDISDFGAVPNDSTFDNAPIIMAAQDSILDKSRIALGQRNYIPCLVKIPAGQYTLLSPIYLEDSVILQGAGDDVSILASSPAIVPLMLGMRRQTQWDQSLKWTKGLTARFSEDHRVDLYGKADVSLAPSQGARHGITTHSPSSGSPHPDHFVCVWAAPPANGFQDGWATFDQLVIDFMLEGPNGGPPLGQGIMGMGTAGDDSPSPWVIDQYYEPNLWGGRRVFRFSFITAEGVKNAFNSPRSFIFGDVSSLKGPARITIQPNFRVADAKGLCDIRVWINGVVQEIYPFYGCRLKTATATEPSFTPADGLHLDFNKKEAFHIGNADNIDCRWGYPDDLAARGDFSLYGLYIGNSVDYTSDANGNQVRLDGKSIIDIYRYYGGDGRQGKNVHLSLDTQPMGDYQGRQVLFNNSWMGGTYGYFVATDVIDSVVTNNKVSDLTIANPNGGVACLIYRSIQVAFANATMNGGWVGIYGAKTGAVYYVDLHNVRLSGNDCGFFADSQIVRASLINQFYVGNTVFRFAGCDFDVRDIRVSTVNPNANPGSIVEVLPGGYASKCGVSDTTADDESGNSHPAVVVWNSPQGTHLGVSNILNSYRDGKTPLVVLKDRNPTNNAPGHFTMFTVQPQRGPIVAADGNWTGFAFGFTTGEDVTESAIVNTSGASVKTIP